MTGSSSSREELLSSLARHVRVLEERKSALTQLARTSSQMLATLEHGGTGSIGPILERRGEECVRFGKLCEESRADDRVLADAANRAAKNANDEAGRLARKALCLRNDSQSLADEIVACQNRCEEVLKKRLAATARALKESSQRRSLDAAYGPACKHDSPAFLDAHQ